MQPSITLPGLDRLISTCQAHHLRLELNPLVDAANPQDMLLGQVLDLVLSATLSRFNGMFFHELSVFPIDDTPYGLGPLNARRRADDEWPLPDVLLYAKFDGFPYYLATVPFLAGSDGIQPVVYVNIIDIQVMPVAASVDKAFDLYARYLEALAARNVSLSARYGSIRAGERALGGFHFPDSIPALVAEDRKLVQMLEANRFDAFTSVDPDLPKWSESIQRAARTRA